MTAMLAFCVCGHTSDEHRAGAACSHVNAASKRFATPARCTCTRYRVSEQMPDAEVFLAKQLNAIIRKEGIPDVSHADRDDLLQVMRISLWKASSKYDSRSHIRFGSYASFEVYNDAIDEIRSARMFGRQGQHRLQPLIASGEDDSWIVDPIDPLDDDAGGARRLERVIAEFTVDPPDAGDIDFRWSLTEGDRETLRTAGERGSGPSVGPASGARSPAWASGLSALIPTKEEAAA